MRDDTTIDGLEKMLSTREVAGYLGAAPEAIYDLRTTGRGPRAVQVGRELRCGISEIQATSGRCRPRRANWLLIPAVGLTRGKTMRSMLAERK